MPKSRKNELTAGEMQMVLNIFSIAMASNPIRPDIIGVTPSAIDAWTGVRFSQFRYEMCYRLQEYGWIKIGYVGGGGMSFSIPENRVDTLRMRASRAAMRVSRRSYSTPDPELAYKYRWGANPPIDEG